MVVPMGDFTGVLVVPFPWPAWSCPSLLLPSLPQASMEVPCLVPAELPLQDVVEGTRAQRVAEVAAWSCGTPRSPFGGPVAANLMLRNVGSALWPRREDDLASGVQVQGTTLSLLAYASAGAQKCYIFPQWSALCTERHLTRLWVHWVTGRRWHGERKAVTWLTKQRRSGSYN